MVKENGEGYYEAELHRLKGQLLLSKSDRSKLSIQSGSIDVDRGPVENAHHCFDQAIMIAQRQKAKSLELRAAVSLAHLYNKNARQQEARQLLAETYNQLGEGFDIADLRQAKALLDAW